MVNTSLLFGISFMIPVSIGFGIVGIIYLVVTRDVKKPKAEKTASYDIGNDYSATQALEKKQMLNYIAQLESYAKQVELASKGKPNSQQWILYAKNLKTYAESLKKQLR